MTLLLVSIFNELFNQKLDCIWLLMNVKNSLDFILAEENRNIRSIIEKLDWIVDNIYINCP